MDDIERTWKVFCVDTFDGTKWQHGSFASREEAEAAARSIGGTMLRAHVEDPSGKRIGSYGTS
jgi:hypothetical protein